MAGELVCALSVTPLPSGDLWSAFVRWLAAGKGPENSIPIGEVSWPPQRGAIHLDVLSLINKLPIPCLSLDASPKGLIEVVFTKEIVIYLRVPRSISVHEDNWGVSDWEVGKRSEFPRESSGSLHPDSQLMPQ